LARSVPTTEPDFLIAGDSWSWTKTLSDYPPSEGWTLHYSFRGASALADADVVATTSGSGYSVVVDKTKTALLTAGAYKWQSYVTNVGGERYTVETGIVTVIAALSALIGSQGQTHVERVLAKIEAEIEARITGTGSTHESYSVNGRAISKTSLENLVKLRGVYAAKVARLNNPGRLGTPVLAVMSPPSNNIGNAEPTVLPWWYRNG
jgi:hypothetical protein